MLDRQGYKNFLDISSLASSSAFPKTDMYKDIDGENYYAKVITSPRNLVDIK